MPKTETEFQGTELHILNTHRGHKKAKEALTIESSVEDRSKLAKKVTALIRDGYSVFVNERMVIGYDAKTDEWVTKAKRKTKPKQDRIPAKGTKANAVAPVAGG